ncbi:DMT family transporter [Corynebacterium liangguodongii]|uniref:DMT family transporter n=1 Tax=Corynebacterium liangguodongii TaxID=2079535 RepID=UPI001F2E4FDC|nr:DMT family transporter [Corynebacterium liangguodongii]
MLLVLIALAIGSIVPIQTAANSRLRLHVGGYPVVSALISFSVALAVAVVATSAITRIPMPDVEAVARSPWWVWLGGAFGVSFVIGNIVLFPRIGAVQTVVLPILGQVAMGLAIDRFGLFRAPEMEVGAGRVLGAAMVLAGIIAVVRPPRAESAQRGLGLWWWRALGVSIGAASAMQTTVNGYLGGPAGSSLHAAEINLAVGALILFVAALATSPRQLARRPKPGPWWMWLGGVVGATFVIGGATLAPLLGTATTVIAINAGTIIGGQLMESMGWFGALRTRIDARRALGLAFILAGVVAVRAL